MLSVHVSMINIAASCVVYFPWKFLVTHTVWFSSYEHSQFNLYTRVDGVS